MEKFLLWILDRFKWLFILLDVDYDQLRSIVAVKLMMDNRRQLVAYKKKNDKEPGNSFVMVVVVYTIFGLFVAWMMYIVPSFMPSMIVFFSMIMVMVVMTLITDFSSILLDTSDNTIILPRPVNGRTLFVARTTHILIYISQFVSGLVIAPLGVVVFLYGPVFAILFLLAIILSVMFSMALTNGLYLLVMQFSSEEKLKNIINYFQIGMAVFMMAGYQILPRMLGRFELAAYVFEYHWWSFLIPSVWMAGALETIHSGSPDVQHIVLILTAIIVPLFTLYAMNTYLTPIFAKKLGAIASNTDQVVVKKEQQNANSLIEKIGTFITRPFVERGAFETMYKILGRDRKIKLKIYPSYGYILIFGFIFMLRGKEDLATTWGQLPEGNYHIILIYLTFMVMQVAMHEIPYSDDFKASWIYFSAPVDKPGEILSGTLKAVMMRLFVPGYIGISIFVLAVWRLEAIDDLIFGFFNNYLMLLILAAMSRHYLPFSMAPNARNQAGNFVRMMLTFIVIFFIGAGHYVLALKPIFMLAAIPVQLVVVFLLHRAYRDMSWDKITL